jgi:hypothetical protein
MVQLGNKDVRIPRLRAKTRGGEGKGVWGSERRQPNHHQGMLRPIKSVAPEIQSFAPLG